MIKSYSSKPRQPKKPQGAQNGFSALVALLPYSFYEFIRGFILGSIGAIVASVAASIVMTQIGLTEDKPFVWRLPSAIATFIIFFLTEKRFHLPGISQSLITALMVFTSVVALSGAFFSAYAITDVFLGDSTANVTWWSILLGSWFYVIGSFVLCVWWAVPLIAWGSWFWRELWRLT